MIPTVYVCFSNEDGGADDVSRPVAVFSTLAAAMAYWDRAAVPEARELPADFQPPSLGLRLAVEWSYDKNDPGPVVWERLSDGRMWLRIAELVLDQEVTE